MPIIACRSPVAEANARPCRSSAGTRRDRRRNGAWPIRQEGGSATTIRQPALANSPSSRAEAFELAPHVFDAVSFLDLVPASSSPQRTWPPSSHPVLLRPGGAGRLRQLARGQTVAVRFPITPTKPVLRAEHGTAPMTRQAGRSEAVSSGPSAMNDHLCQSWPT